MKKNYRVRRPAKYDDLLNLMKDNEEGVFSTFASALVFAAAYGYKKNIREPVESKDSSEPISITIFKEHTEIPFMYLLALAVEQDVSYLQESKFGDVLQIFEEFAAGGLSLLENELNKTDIRQSIENMLNEVDTDFTEIFSEGF